MSLTVLGDGPSSSQPNLVYVTVKLARDSSCKAGMLQLELAAGARGAGGAGLGLLPLAGGSGTRLAALFPPLSLPRALP